MKDPINEAAEFAPDAIAQPMTYGALPPPVLFKHDRSAAFKPGDIIVLESEPGALNDDAIRQLDEMLGRAAKECGIKIIVLPPNLKVARANQEATEPTESTELDSVVYAQVSSLLEDYSRAIREGLVISADPADGDQVRISMETESAERISEARSALMERIAELIKPATERAPKNFDLTEQLTRLSNLSRKRGDECFYSDHDQIDVEVAECISAITKMFESSHLVWSAIPQVVARLLHSDFWLPTLSPKIRYRRIHDDTDGHNTEGLNVVIGEDGDAWVSTDGSLRFRMPLHGGGSSRFTRTALVVLAEAIRLDNEARPIRGSGI